MSRFVSRKFLLAVLFAFASTAGLFIGRLDGTAWVASIAAILGAYGAANVMHRRAK